MCTLFDGTLAENISRFDPHVSPDRLEAAIARAAAADLVDSFPYGLDTQVTGQTSDLPSSHIAHIALARALYSDPAILVLDNLHLGAEGALAPVLDEVMRAYLGAGNAAIVTSATSRVPAFCTHVAAMQNARLSQLNPQGDAALGQVRHG